MSAGISGDAANVMAEKLSVLRENVRAALHPSVSFLKGRLVTCKTESLLAENKVRLHSLEAMEGDVGSLEGQPWEGSFNDPLDNGDPSGWAVCCTFIKPTDLSFRQVQRSEENDVPTNSPKQVFHERWEWIWHRLKAWRTADLQSFRLLQMKVLWRICLISGRELGGKEKSPKALKTVLLWVGNLRICSPLPETIVSTRAQTDCWISAPKRNI
ncbi:uncharacterized protein LOC108712517 isoform X1 [Xenopus laevis]|uniref:Uncharacterized protein LOC108712517 isoform X1 n=1 Tax=Xenopus laevis TaxID=8355 RepID=A0A8J1MPQ6_XENLA|nr:uncharacterized protein LOC108712517 isoform X1 [Xenopus laevis]XP_041443775.1 uncharacterized protein LOC108712517 isoform X1 [Xenopus laevis]